MHSYLGLGLRFSIISCVIVSSVSSVESACEPQIGSHLISAIWSYTNNISELKLDIQRAKLKLNDCVHGLYIVPCWQRWLKIKEIGNFSWKNIKNRKFWAVRTSESGIDHFLASSRALFRTRDFLWMYSVNN